MKKIIIVCEGQTEEAFVKKTPVSRAMAQESVRAKLRLLAKKVLRRHGYPPDKKEKATRTVLEQAELLSAEWVT